MQNLITEVNKVLKYYPSLEISGEGMLSGFIEVDINDLYQIEIKYNGFPKGFPIVREIEGRIPRKADRHVYENGQCCLTTAAIEQLMLRKKRISSLLDFVNKIVVPYFQNNSYYEHNGKYKYGDYAHGIFGHFQSYAHVLDISNMTIVLDLLINRLKNKKYNKNEPCYCGNGKKIKNCHLYHYNDLFFIDDKLIKKDMEELRKVYQ